MRKKKYRIDPFLNHKNIVLKNQKLLPQRHLSAYLYNGHFETADKQTFTAKKEFNELQNINSRFFLNKRLAKSATVRNNQESSKNRQDYEYEDKKMLSSQENSEVIKKNLKRENSLRQDLKFQKSNNDLQFTRLESDLFIF